MAILSVMPRKKPTPTRTPGRDTTVLYLRVPTDVHYKLAAEQKRRGYPWTIASTASDLLANALGGAS